MGKSAADSDGIGSDFILNPAAWSDAGPGEWGTSAAFCRQQRRKVEQPGVGRTFTISEGLSLQFRAEFFKAFNRTQMGNPDSTSALAARQRNAAGVPTAGFGRINTANLAGNPREGHLLIRLRF